MKAICFYFQIHQPFRLKRYRFFDIGNDHYYFDDFANDDIITRIAANSYIPAAESLLRMIEATNGAFRCAISVTGTALDQFEQYVPEFIDLLKKLAKTGKVEFLAETYAHSLASLADPEEFRLQVKAHSEKLHTLFGVKPKVLRNTELIYCDDLAPQIYDMDFKGCITEGAKHILGWKSPNYVYSAASCPKLKLLLKNSKLSDDIAFRFSNTEWDGYPMTADKYIDWIASTPAEEQIINLFMNLETFGELQPASSGIFQFLETLPRFAAERGVEFWTPTEAVQKLKPVAELSVMHPISWADEARDTSAWLGNQLQQEAFNKLYSVAERPSCYRPQTPRRLVAPSGIRPLLLYVDQTYGRRRCPQPFLALRHPVRRLYELYERVGRLHCARRRAVSPFDRERGTQRAADDDTQSGARDRDPQQRGGVDAPEYRASQRRAPASRTQKERSGRGSRQA